MFSGPALLENGRGHYPPLQTFRGACRGSHVADYHVCVRALSVHRAGPAADNIVLPFRQ